MGKGDMKTRKGKVTRGSYVALWPKKAANKNARKVKLGLIRRRAIGEKKGANALFLVLRMRGFDQAKFKKNDYPLIFL